MTWDIAILLLPGLVIGITVHEFAHAWSAWLLGDGLARSKGRVSLNPVRHLSPLGTAVIFFLPFGWGRPVPVNLYNFRKPKRDYLLTSLAGPAANIIAAGACVLLMLGTRHTYAFDGWARNVVFLAHDYLMYTALINVSLGVLNLLPVPPLDGSKIWPCVIPHLNISALSGKKTFAFLLVLVVLLMSGSLRPALRAATRTVVTWMPQSDFDVLIDHFDAGWEAYDRENFGQAEIHFTRTLELDPDEPACLQARATVRQALKKYPGALTDITRAIEIAPTADQYDIRSNIHTRLGNLKQAEADRRLANALRASPPTQPSP
jgi:Zn-dependent protease